jgi:hypothetical protein
VAGAQERRRHRAAAAQPAARTPAPPTLPADALSLQRLLGQALQRDLRRAAARPGLGIETRAHLNDSLALLEASLRASIVRAN